MQRKKFINCRNLTACATDSLRDALVKLKYVARVHVKMNEYRITGVIRSRSKIKSNTEPV